MHQKDCLVLYSFVFFRNNHLFEFLVHFVDFPNMELDFPNGFLDFLHFFDESIVVVSFNLGFYWVLVFSRLVNADSLIFFDEL